MKLARFNRRLIKRMTAASSSPSCDAIASNGILSSHAISMMRDSSASDSFIISLAVNTSLKPTQMGSKVLSSQREGAHELDLLAYRSEASDDPALISTVCRETDKPVIMAGSVADSARISVLRNAGAAGFSIGTAALEGAYPGAVESLETQIAAIVHGVAALNGHLSPFGRKSPHHASDIC
ncbi:MAG: hypothetical protein WBG92_23445 [Thiohalocapsa sp.]